MYVVTGVQAPAHSLEEPRKVLGDIFSEPAMLLIAEEEKICLKMLRPSASLSPTITQVER